MADRHSLTTREITILAILVVVCVGSIFVVKNPRRVLMLFPFGQKMAQMGVLLDLNEALNRFKMSGQNVEILNPRTPLPVVFEIVRHYVNPKSTLLGLNAKEYNDIINSIRTEGSGMEFQFTRYKMATFPDPSLH